MKSQKGGLITLLNGDYIYIVNMYYLAHILFPIEEIPSVSEINRILTKHSIRIDIRGKMAKYINISEKEENLLELNEEDLVDLMEKGLFNDRLYFFWRVQCQIKEEPTTALYININNLGKNRLIKEVPISTRIPLEESDLKFHKILPLRFLDKEFIKKVSGRRKKKSGYKKKRRINK